MKITEEQLKKVNEQQAVLGDILNRIGLLETEKHSLLHRVAEVNKDIEDTKKELEEQYGAVSIDLKTGEYEPIAFPPPSKSFNPVDAAGFISLIFSAFSTPFISDVILVNTSGITLKLCVLAKVVNKVSLI